METDEIRHALQLIQNCIESEGKDYGQLKEAWNLLSEHIDKLEKVVSPSEDKTAEEILDKHFPLSESQRCDYDDRLITAMKEYGTVRWNKAIEEALLALGGQQLLSEKIISELNKLKV